MFEEQEIVNITKEELLDKVHFIFTKEYRLVQIGCTQEKDCYHIDYTFDKDYKFHNLRVKLPLDDLKLPSISDVYFAAFVYENEIHDLFGVEVSGMKVDFGGKFYRIEAKNPFRLNDSEEIAKKD